MHAMYSVNIPRSVGYQHGQGAKAWDINTVQAPKPGTSTIRGSNSRCWLLSTVRGHRRTPRQPTVPRLLAVYVAGTPCTAQTSHAAWDTNTVKAPKRGI